MTHERKQANAMRSSKDRPARRPSSRRSSPTSAARVRLVLGATALSTLLAATALLAPAQANSKTPGATAHAAGAFTLDESGSLRLTSKHGFTLNEQGTATGTVRGAIYVHLTIASSKRVTAEVNIYPRGGSITGFGAASYRRRHTDAVFSGTLSVERGSGSYAHAHGSGLSFSGTIQRTSEAITVRVNGRVSD